MKKSMKKFIAMLFITVLSISTLAMPAGAAVDLRFPQELTLKMDNDGSGYRTAYYEDGVQTGWTIDKTGNIWGGTGQSRLHGSGGNISRIKGNFVYEFDFMASKIDKIIFWIGGQQTMVFGRYRTTDVYYIYAAADNSILSPSASIVGSGKTEQMFQLDKWYTMKMEGDMSQGGKIYITVTDSNGSEPAVYEGVINNNNITYTEEEAISADKSYGIQWGNSGECNFTIKNEKFTYDSYFTESPEIAVENGTVSAKTTFYNLAPINNNPTPYVVCAVYGSDGSLKAYKANSATAPSMAGGVYPKGKSDVSCTAAIDQALDDGTYTVKAFVWNSFDKLMPYKPSVTKTIKVENGAASVTE